MSDFINKLEKEGFPFVLFRSPKTKGINCYYQTDNSTHTTVDFSQEGFVFSPFEKVDSYIFIPKANCRKINDLEVSGSSNRAKDIKDDINQLPYTDLVKKALASIENNEFSKVVLSRKIEVQLNANPINLFKQLDDLYPNAFVYYWSHPKTGKWLGATPERFIKLTTKELHTVALAGTLSKNQTQWSAKELYEQQLVTDSIVSSLTDLAPNQAPRVEPTKTIAAGSLKHLRTKITLTNPKVPLKNLINTLHPTPATGGFPKLESMFFIQKNEGYNRRFYTGFLGPFSNMFNADFFVNLRCAQITKKGLDIYVGAGITKDSNPFMEWEETQRKAQTFLAVL